MPVSCFDRWQIDMARERKSILFDQRLIVLLCRSSVDSTIGRKLDSRKARLPRTNRIECLLITRSVCRQWVIGLTLVEHNSVKWKDICTKSSWHLLDQRRPSAACQHWSEGNLLESFQDDAAWNRTCCWSSIIALVRFEVRLIHYPWHRDQLGRNRWTSARWSCLKEVILLLC